MNAVQQAQHNRNIVAAILLFKQFRERMDAKGLYPGLTQVSMESNLLAMVAWNDFLLEIMRDLGDATYGPQGQELDREGRRGNNLVLDLISTLSVQACGKIVKLRKEQRS